MTSKREDSNTASKTYWSILNRFLYNKKIRTIPPLLVDGNFISNFCEKANLFNNGFDSFVRLQKIIADYLLLSIKKHQNSLPLCYGSGYIINNKFIKFQ